MSSGLYELKKTIYTTLTGDATLMALVDGVYEHVPETANHPFIVFGDAQVEDVSTVSQQAEEITFNLHTHTRGHSQKACLDIMGRVHTVLHDTDLTATGWNVIYLRITVSDVERNNNQVSFEGVQQINAVMEKTT